MEDLQREIRDLLAENPNKVQRKRNLLKLQESLARPEVKPHLEALWTEFHVDLFKLMQDESERCREIATEIVTSFYSEVKINSKSENLHLQFLFPIVLRGLAGQEGNESSEEVRLHQMRLVLNLASQPDLSRVLKPFLDDLAKILKGVLNDPYAEVRVTSCEVVCRLAENVKDFHLIAENLAGHVAKNLAHQQKKVRITSLRAFGIPNSCPFIFLA